MGYTAWHSHNAEDEPFVILPDGCRDLIVLTHPNGQREVYVTTLDHAPRGIFIAKGTQFEGYRLAPGSTPDWDALIAAAHRGDSPARLLSQMTALPDENQPLIGALSAPGSTVARVARAEGVTPRSLQRRFKASGLPPPSFWHQLGRARRAARALSGDLPLAALAADFGYSDQAHMSREFRRWFGQTAQTLRRTPALLGQLDHSGLGTWTGEQISTK